MKRIFLFLLSITAVCPAVAQYAFSPELLGRFAAAYREGDPRAVRAAERVIAASGELLEMEPMTVTSKKQLPPSGDRRDYMSLSPYWWPDRSKPDGLPYVRRDGERNPEVYDFPERENGDRLGYAARTLAVLYHVTGDERYAAKCAELLRTWFLDPEQGMNPNMTYAQLIRGRTTIRGTGTIDARRMCFALNAASLIGNSPAWSDGDRAALGEWARAFLYWLEHSVNGQKELHASNNHGLWYDAIRLMTAQAAGLGGRVREIAEKSVKPRFTAQVAADGSLPEELERTLSLHYSTFVLEALSTARNMALPSGVDLWRMPEAQRVLEFLLPYYEKPDTWPYPQIKPFERRRGAALLYEAGVALGRSEWIDAARRIGYGEGKADFAALLFFELQ